MRIIQIALLVLQILLIANYQAPYDTDKQDFAKILMTNNDILEASLDKKVESVEYEVRRHFPQYRPLVPVVKEVHDVTESLCSVLDFFNQSENTEAGNQALYEYVVDSRATLVKILERAESREMGIRARDINNLIKNLNLKTKVKRPEYQAKRKRLFQAEQPNPQLVELLRQKNDALIIANKIIDFLSRRIGSTSIACGFYPSTIVSTPEKGFVKTGETFETKIFLTAHYTQRMYGNETIIKVNGKTLPVRYGTAIYRTTPQVSGEHQYEVEIIRSNRYTERSRTYRRTFSFEVGERCY